MENPIEMDDLGVPPFKETPKWFVTRQIKDEGRHLGLLVAPAAR